MDDQVSVWRSSLVRWDDSLGSSAVEPLDRPVGRMTPLEHYWQSILGGFWFEQSYQRLLDGLPKLTPSVWVEVGVYEGASISWLGVEVLNRGLPVTIHAVDSFAGWPGVLQGEALRAAFDAHTLPIRQRLNGQFQVHPTPSPQAAADFADASCDVIWIDADHSYEACRADIEAWFPKLKPGGIIGGDDYMMPGVSQAVAEVFGMDHSLIPGWRRDEGIYVGAWPSWVVRK